MSATPLPESACLGCGDPLAFASDPFGGARPSPGDFTVCLTCGHLMVFADDLTLRQPTDAEAKSIAGDRRLIAMQRARGIVMGRRKPTQQKS